LDDAGVVGLPGHRRVAGSARSARVGGEGRAVQGVLELGEQFEDLALVQSAFERVLDVREVLVDRVSPPHGPDGRLGQAHFWHGATLNQGLGRFRREP